MSDAANKNASFDAERKVVVLRRKKAARRRLLYDLYHSVLFVARRGFEHPVSLTLRGRRHLVADPDRTRFTRVTNGMPSTPLRAFVTGFCFCACGKSHIFSPGKAIEIGGFTKMTPHPI
jgi:hypothetical protein